MSVKLRLAALTIAMTLIIPAILLQIGEKVYFLHDRENTDFVKQTEGTVVPIYLSVLMEDGSVRTFDMNDYLVSVLLREMPADFELEALKAQAVAVRTYTLLRYEKNGRHENADVCTDSSCCQAYWDQDKYLEDGGTSEAIARIRTAVLETEDQVLKYKDELIDATYFACSGGMTEDAIAVWGNNIPYLRSVESPGEEDAKHYEDSVSFSKTELIEKLGLKGDVDAFKIEDIRYTNGGGIDTITICGETIKGTTLRKKLSLNSTAMLISVLDDSVIIITKGKGHRVGMSQYGANAMAENGATYKEILAHYYYETVLVSYEPH